MELKFEFVRRPYSENTVELKQLDQLQAMDNVYRSIPSYIPSIEAAGGVVVVYHDNGKILGYSLSNCQDCELINAVSSVAGNVTQADMKEIMAA